MSPRIFRSILVLSAFLVFERGALAEDCSRLRGAARTRCEIRQDEDAAGGGGLAVVQETGTDANRTVRSTTAGLRGHAMTAAGNEGQIDLGIGSGLRYGGGATVNTIEHDARAGLAAHIAGKGRSGSVDDAIQGKSDVSDGHWEFGLGLALRSESERVRGNLTAGVASVDWRRDRAAGSRTAGAITSERSRADGAYLRLALGAAHVGVIQSTCYLLGNAHLRLDLGDVTTEARGGHSNFCELGAQTNGKQVGPAQVSVFTSASLGKRMLPNAAFRSTLTGVASPLRQIDFGVSVFPAR